MGRFGIGKKVLMQEFGCPSCGIVDYEARDSGFALAVVHGFDVTPFEAVADLPGRESGMLADASIRESEGG
jgi:hypothetical protein